MTHRPVCIIVCVNKVPCPPPLCLESSLWTNRGPALTTTPEYQTMYVAYNPKSLVQPISAKTGVDALESIAAFFKELLRLRAEGKHSEIEGHIDLDKPEFRDAWTNPHGSKLRLFTLTRNVDHATHLSGWAFRCWARPYAKVTVDDHFETIDLGALLFEVRSDEYQILLQWAQRHFTDDLYPWECNLHSRKSILWLGEG